MATDIRERLRDLAEEAPSGRAVPPRLVGRARRRMALTVTASACAAAVAVVLALSGLRAFQHSTAPGGSPPPSIVDGVHGWIAVGGESSITAVDALDPTRTMTLSDRPGDVLAWSNDGTELAIHRLVNGHDDVFVLMGDGTEVRVATDALSASFSPDGTEVIYDGRDMGIHAVGLDGGPSRTIVAGDQASFSGAGVPVASPDGAHIAYVPVSNGQYGGGNGLVSSDGTGRRDLVSPAELDRLMGSTVGTTVYPMAWSPDGGTLAFGAGHRGVTSAIFVVNVDGTGLRRITPTD